MGEGGCHHMHWPLTLHHDMSDFYRVKGLILHTHTHTHHRPTQFHIIALVQNVTLLLCQFTAYVASCTKSRFLFPYLSLPSLPCPHSLHLHRQQGSVRGEETVLQAAGEGVQRARHGPEVPGSRWLPPGPPRDPDEDERLTATEVWQSQNTVVSL